MRSPLRKEWRWGTNSFGVHRAELSCTIKNRRLLQTAQHLVLIPARSLQLKLNAHVLLGRGNLHVLHHGVDTFQNAVDLRSNFVGTAAGNFVTADCGFQTKSFFRAPQQEKAKQNEGSGKDRCEIESSTHR